MMESKEDSANLAREFEKEDDAALKRAQEIYNLFVQTMIDAKIDGHGIFLTLEHLGCLCLLTCIDLIYKMDKEHPKEMVKVMIDRVGRLHSYHLSKKGN